jgi:ATP-dependent RNA helicase DeaD
VQVAHGTARALRRLRTEQLDLLVAAPETALALLQRAALKLEAVRSLVVAWPEQWEEAAALDALLQDLPKDAQRIVHTSDPARAGEFSERWARRALTLGTLPLAAPGDDTPPPPTHPLGPVRTVQVSWQRRAAALGELVDLLDPQSLVVWTADRSQEASIVRALPLSDPAIRTTTGDAPAAQYVVAFDLPGRDRLQQLLSAGEVILLVPPGTDGYVRRVAASPRPLRLPGIMEQVATAGAARRATIQRQLEAARPEHALAVLAPLFERHDPAAVAAALYDLWLQGAGGQAPSALPDVPATTRIFVGVGKRDGATPADIVAVLTKELKVDRSKIGRIELRDAFSLVELPAMDAERIAQAMNGAQIRRKRVTVRVDRGPTQREERGERGDRGDRGGYGSRGPARTRA